MPVHFLPWHVLPGHHRGWTLCFGTLPLTHGFTFQNTGPTSAYSERYLRPSLLRASFSPLASGWHLPLQRHFRALTKFAHVESRLSGRKRQREVVFHAPVNLCDRRPCSTSVAVGLLHEV